MAEKWIRELDWASLKPLDAVRITRGDKAFEGHITEDGLRVDVGTSAPMVFTWFQRENYSLYVVNPEWAHEPTDEEVAVANERLKAYTQPKMPIERTPWSPTLIGFVAVFAVAAIILIGILVARR